MRRWHALACAGGVLAAGAIAGCQVVSGIANLDIVGDAGSDATAEAAVPSDATGDSPADSTVEASLDGTSEAEAASDSPSSGEAGTDAASDAEGGNDATLDSSDAGPASDATGGGDASEAGGGDAGEAGGGDASDGGSASDGPVEGGCSFGWQCSAGYCGTNGVCAEPPSCVGLAKTCGPGGNEDCCASITIPAGDAGVQYYRSFDGMMYTNMSNPATLAGPFALDKFEVTVERFESFIAAYTGASPTAGSGGYPPVAGTGWQSAWPYPASQAALLASVTSITTACSQPFAPASGTPTTPDLPMNCIDWYLAFQFCASDGSRLPTEAEWNFAAGGGTAQRIYPWLVGPPQIDSTFAWYDCTGMGTMEPDGGPGTCMPPASPLPVGSFTKGQALYGHDDMAGSMVEPTMDFFGSYPNPCTNCVNTNAASGERVYRGGSWMDPPQNLDDGYRSGMTPTSGGSTTGIRCAR